MLQSIPPIAFAAVGTIAAAMISGCIAFLSLLISKEHVVSEFRQKWIDALRDDLADYMSAATSISVQAQLNKELKGDEKISLRDAIASIESHISMAYRTYHRIILRLNPTEHSELRRLVNDVEQSLSKPSVIGDATRFGSLCDDLNSEAHRVLKAEWNRVKYGEATYRAVKVLSAAVFGFAVISAVFLLL